MCFLRIHISYNIAHVHSLTLLSWRSKASATHNDYALRVYDDTSSRDITNAWHIYRQMREHTHLLGIQSVRPQRRALGNIFRTLAASRGAANQRGEIMLRKSAKPRSAGKQKKTSGTTAQRASVSAMANRLTVTPDRDTASRRIEARLKSAATEAFKKMGED
jgi:hypothetical protein